METEKPIRARRALKPEPEYIAEQARKERKNKRIKWWKENWLISLLFVTVFVHFLFKMNTTYCVTYGYYERETCGLSSSQYKDLLHSLGEYKTAAILSTKVFYFEIVPEWVVNIFYCIYFLFIFMAVYAVRKIINAAKSKDE